MESNISQSNTAHQFYKETMQLLNEHSLPFLVGGAFALRHYTDIHRDTKDLDLFCKAEDYPRILKLLSEKGFITEVTDPRWIAKAFKEKHFVDLIFNTTNNICPVDDSWMEHGVEGELFTVHIKLLAAEELLWTKLYVHNRERYDGADINHLILRYGKQLDWKRLYKRIGQHWHLLLAQLLNFQFVYPSDKEIIPAWLFQELLDLAGKQFELPSPVVKVCLGPLIDHTQYQIDIMEWNYRSLTTKTI